VATVPGGWRRWFPFHAAGGDSSDQPVSGVSV
jgi:hypothetical protein